MRFPARKAHCCFYYSINFRGHFKQNYSVPNIHSQSIMNYTLCTMSYILSNKKLTNAVYFNLNKGIRVRFFSLIFLLRDKKQK